MEKANTTLNIARTSSVPSLLPYPSAPRSPSSSASLSPTSSPFGSSLNSPIGNPLVFLIDESSNKPIVNETTIPSFKVSKEKKTKKFGRRKKISRDITYYNLGTSTGSSKKINYHCHLLNGTIVNYTAQGSVQLFGPPPNRSLLLGYADPFYLWAHCPEWIATYHKENILRLYNCKEALCGAFKWTVLEECLDLIVSSNSLLCLTSSCLYWFAIRTYNGLIVHHLMRTYKMTISQTKVITKLNGNIFLCLINSHVLLFHLHHEQPIISQYSKDGSYFINGQIQENRIFCATASSLYIFTFDLEKDISVTEIIVPLPSPVCLIRKQDNYLITGSFDGIIRLYDLNNMATHLYDLNTGDTPYSPLVTSDEDENRFTLLKRVTAIKCIGDFVVIATRHGLCDVWALNTKYQSQPIASFMLREDEFVSEISTDDPDSPLLFLVVNNSKRMYGSFTWKPKQDKLERFHNETLLMEYISKPKAGKKGIFGEWKSYNFSGMENEDFILSIQTLAEKEYPYLMNCHESCTITNNTLPNNPIVFVNDTFIEMTGYSRDEILGRNCRFLQGRYTDSETVKKISEAVKQGKTMSVQILNYRKDGVPFWNIFVILPVHDSKGTVPAFIAIQKDITEIKLEQPLQEWHWHHTALWLEKIGFGVYSQVFSHFKIDGRKLLNLTPKALVELGVAPVDVDPLLQNITMIPKEFTRKDVSDTERRPRKTKKHKSRAKSATHNSQKDFIHKTKLATVPTNLSMAFSLPNGDRSEASKSETETSSERLVSPNKSPHSLSGEFDKPANPDPAPKQVPLNDSNSSVDEKQPQRVLLEGAGVVSPRTNIRKQHIKKVTSTTHGVMKRNITQND